MLPGVNSWPAFLPPDSAGRKTIPNCGARPSPARGHSSGTQVCSNGPAEASPRDFVSFTLCIARQCMDVCRRAGRSRLHRLIGEELEKAYGGEGDANANQLARHFRYGGDHPRAIRYFRLAAEQALRRSAHREAVSLLQCGLELVERQPETPERHAAEFALRSMMAPAILAVKGFRRAGGSAQFSARARTRTPPGAGGRNVPAPLSSRRDARTSWRVPAGGTDSE